MESVKYDLKLFVQEPIGVELDAFIPIFHHWIQNQVLDDVLIDVTDYRHVHHGPGVMLIGHEAHYAIDMADGRMGLLYSRRRETHASQIGSYGIAERLKSVFSTALAVCQRLEADATLQGNLKFRGDELLVRVNDRLLAPNRSDAFARLLGPLEPVLQHLYPGGTVKLEPVADPKSRLTVHVKAADSPDVNTLLKRLDGIETAVGGAV